MTVTLTATPGDVDCPECEGSGESSYERADYWPCSSAWDCAWCHGTGKVLRPIPVAQALAALGCAEIPVGPPRGLVSRGGRPV